jgi:hypothetical protein
MLVEGKTMAWRVSWDVERGIKFDALSKNITNVTCRGTERKNLFKEGGILVFCTIISPYYLGSHHINSFLPPVKVSDEMRIQPPIKNINFYLLARGVACRR